MSDDLRLIVNIVSRKDYKAAEKANEAKSDDVYTKKAKGKSAWEALENIKYDDGSRVFSDTEIWKICYGNNKKANPKNSRIPIPQKNGELDLTDAIKRAGFGDRLKKLAEEDQGLTNNSSDTTSADSTENVFTETPAAPESANPFLATNEIEVQPEQPQAPQVQEPQQQEIQNQLQYTGNKLNDLFIAAYTVIDDDTKLTIDINGSKVTKTKSEILELLTKDGTISAEEQIAFIISAREAAQKSFNADGKNQKMKKGEKNTEEYLKAFEAMPAEDFYFGHGKQSRFSKNYLKNNERNAQLSARRVLTKLSDKELNKIAAEAKNADISVKIETENTTPANNEPKKLSEAKRKEAKEAFKIPPQNINLEEMTIISDTDNNIVLADNNNKTEVTLSFNGNRVSSVKIVADKNIPTNYEEYTYRKDIYAPETITTSETKDNVQNIETIDLNTLIKTNKTYKDGKLIDFCQTNDYNEVIISKKYTYLDNGVKVEEVDTLKYKTVNKYNANGDLLNSFTLNFIENDKENAIYAKTINGKTVNIDTNLTNESVDTFINIIPAKVLEKVPFSDNETLNITIHSGETEILGLITPTAENASWSIELAKDGSFNIQLLNQEGLYTFDENGVLIKKSPQTAPDIEEVFPPAKVEPAPQPSEEVSEQPAEINAQPEVSPQPNEEVSEQTTAVNTQPEVSPQQQEEKTLDVEQQLQYNNNDLNNLFVSSYKMIPEDEKLTINIDGKKTTGTKKELLELIAKDGLITKEEQAAFILAARAAAKASYNKDGKNRTLKKGEKNTAEDIEVFTKLPLKQFYNLKANFIRRVENNERNALVTARRSLTELSDNELKKIMKNSGDAVITIETTTSHEEQIEPQKDTPAEVQTSTVPVSQEPVVEEPVAQAPVVEEPVAEAPAAKTPVVEEPVAEDPAAETPVVEEPVVQAPTENNVQETATPTTTQPQEEKTFPVLTDMPDPTKDPEAFLTYITSKNDKCGKFLEPLWLENIIISKEGDNYEIKIRGLWAGNDIIDIIAKVEPNGVVSTYIHSRMNSSEGYKLANTYYPDGTTLKDKKQNNVSPTPAPTTTGEVAPSATVEPADTTTDKVAPSATAEPAATTTDKVAPSTTVEPADTTTDKAAPSATVEPADTTTGEVAPSTTVEPADTTTDKVAPSPAEETTATTPTTPPQQDTQPNIRTEVVEDENGDKKIITINESEGTVSIDIKKQNTVGSGYKKTGYISNYNETDKDLTSYFEDTLYYHLDDGRRIEAIETYNKPHTHTHKVTNKEGTVVSTNTFEFNPEKKAIEYNITFGEEESKGTSKKEFKVTSNYTEEATKRFIEKIPEELLAFLGTEITLSDLTIFGNHNISVRNFDTNEYALHYSSKRNDLVDYVVDYSYKDGKLTKDDSCEPDIIFFDRLLNALKLDKGQYEITECKKDGLAIITLNDGTKIIVSDIYEINHKTERINPDGTSESITFNENGDIITTPLKTSREIMNPPKGFDTVVAELYEEYAQPEKLKDGTLVFSRKDENGKLIKVAEVNPNDEYKDIITFKGNEVVTDIYFEDKLIYSIKGDIADYDATKKEITNSKDEVCYNYFEDGFSKTINEEKSTTIKKYNKEGVLITEETFNNHQEEKVHEFGNIQVSSRLTKDDTEKLIKRIPETLLSYLGNKTILTTDTSWSFCLLSDDCTTALKLNNNGTFDLTVGNDDEILYKYSFDSTGNLTLKTPEDAPDLKTTLITANTQTPDIITKTDEDYPVLEDMPNPTEKPMEFLDYIKAKNPMLAKEIDSRIEYNLNQSENANKTEADIITVTQNDNKYELKIGDGRYTIYPNGIVEDHKGIHPRKYYPDGSKKYNEYSSYEIVTSDFRISISAPYYSNEKTDENGTKIDKIAEVYKKGRLYQRFFYAEDGSLLKQELYDTNTNAKPTKITYKDGMPIKQETYESRMEHPATITLIKDDGTQVKSTYIRVTDPSQSAKEGAILKTEETVLKNGVEITTTYKQKTQEFISLVEAGKFAEAEKLAEELINERWQIERIKFKSDRDDKMVMVEGRSVRAAWNTLKYGLDGTLTADRDIKVVKQGLEELQAIMASGGIITKKKLTPEEIMEHYTPIMTQACNELIQLIEEGADIETIKESPEYKKITKLRRFGLSFQNIPIDTTGQIAKAWATILSGNYILSAIETLHNAKQLYPWINIGLTATQEDKTNLEVAKGIAIKYFEYVIAHNATPDVVLKSDAYKKLRKYASCIDKIEFNIDNKNGVVVEPKVIDGQKYDINWLQTTYNELAEAINSSDEAAILKTLEKLAKAQSHGVSLLI